MRLPRSLSAALVLLIAHVPVQGQAPEFARMQQDLETAAQDDRLPSMVGVLFSADAIIWSGAVGHADAEGSVAATLDTPYRAGSISKLATSLLAMQLAAEGRLDLDAPVTHYLPDFAPENPFGQAITMRHLLGHRAGLVREPPIGSYFDFGPVPLATVVASLNETRLVAPPGGDPKYSNAGFAVASRVIEVIAGAPFEDVARARLLLPLGMQSSGFRFAELPARPAHAVLNPLGGPRDPAPLEELAAAGAGSLAATGRDLARLGQALLRAAHGRADGPVTPAMLQAIIDGPAGERLGLGIIIDALDGHRRIGHGGAIHGFTADLALLPDAGIGVVTFATVDGSRAPFRLSDQLLRHALAQQGGDAQIAALPPAEPLPEPVSRALSGTWSGPDGSLFVRQLDGRTWLEAPRTAAELRLRGGRPFLDHDIGWEGEQAIDLDAQTIRLGQAVYRRTTRARPPAARPNIEALAGFYRRGINELILYERDGGLHINIEWSSYEPLAIVAPDRLAFAADSRLYPGEFLDVERGPDGRANAILLNGIRFVRAAGVAEEEERRRAETAPLIADARRAARAASPPVQPPGLDTPDLVDLRRHAPDLIFDIRYATSDNFLGGPIYRTPFAFLQRPAADALVRADRALRADGLRIVVHDGYRPWYVTRLFWELTPPEERMFVADPAEGSRHNRAAAIDVSLADAASGALLDVAGEFDEASPRSYVLHVGGTDLQRWRRDRLIAAMSDAGFDVYPLEWWHFDFRGWERWPVLNIDVDATP